MTESLLREVDCIEEPRVNENEESQHEEQCLLQWLDTVNEVHNVQCNCLMILMIYNECAVRLLLLYFMLELTSSVIITVNTIMIIVNQA